MPSSLTFAVGADTYVNSGSPTTNYGSATVWRVDGSPDLHAYLRFTVQGLAGYSIQSAYPQGICQYQLKPGYQCSDGGG